MMVIQNMHFQMQMEQMVDASFITAQVSYHSMLQESQLYRLLITHKAINLFWIRLILTKVVLQVGWTCNEIVDQIVN